MLKGVQPLILTRGRVEKMLFRPISEKQHSLSFNNTSCRPALLLAIRACVYLCLCVFGVSTLSNQRRDFNSSRPIKLQKRSKFSKNLKFIFFLKKIHIKFQNFQKISIFWGCLGQAEKNEIPYYLIIINTALI
jgi:hypothetical protein